MKPILKCSISRLCMPECDYCMLVITHVIILVSTCQAFLVTHNLISSRSSSALISSPGMPKERTETHPFRVRVFKAEVGFPKCYPVCLRLRDCRPPNSDKTRQVSDWTQIKCDMCDQNSTQQVQEILRHLAPKWLAGTHSTNKLSSEMVEPWLQ